MKILTHTMAMVVATTTACMVSSAMAYAAAQVPHKQQAYFKPPILTGNGCPRGTTDYKISDDGVNLLLWFNNYKAKPGNLACNISLPVHVSRGLQASVIEVDFSGLIEGQAELQRTYFFSWQRGPNKKTALASQDSQIYMTRDNLEILDNKWSRCSRDIHLRLNTRIHTKDRKSSVSIGSKDLPYGIAFHLKYRNCTPE